MIQNKRFVEMKTPEDMLEQAARVSENSADTSAGGVPAVPAAPATPLDPPLDPHLLAAFGGARPPAPAWFRQALADAPQRSTVEVEGAAIEVLESGPVGAPGILLLHGNAAHADWYSFIAPLLVPKYRVAAMSWSGMGGSGWRAQYGAGQHAREAISVARAAGLFESEQKPVFVAHSFGTFALAAIAAQYGAELSGVVVVDSPLRPRAQLDARPPREWRAPGTYASVAAALARFRLIPAQPCEHLYLIDHIARTALKQVEQVEQAERIKAGHGGVPRWAWRFDPFVLKNYDLGNPQRDLGLAQCRVALVRGTLSSVATDARFAYLRDVAPAGSVVREIAHARHHVMLDQPQALAALIDELAAGFFE